MLNVSLAPLLSGSEIRSPQESSRAEDSPQYNIKQDATPPICPVFTFRHFPRIKDAKDLDLFLCQFYNYWSHGGLVPLVISHFLHLVALLFTLVLCWLLLSAIDWTLVFQRCASPETECLWPDILSGSSPSGLLGRLWSQQVVLFLAALGVYLLWSLAVTCLNCRDAASLRRFVRAGVQVPSDDALQSLQWPEALSLLLAAQEYKTEMERLTALDVTNCIMRYDNYLIALANKQILTRHLPSWIPQRLIFTRHLLWNVQVALFSHLFDSQRHLNLSFVSNPAALGRRLRWVAVLNAVLVGPLLLASLLISFFKHAEGVRSDLSRPFERRFNLYAEWTFRSFNELQHLAAKRMCVASSAVSSYLHLRPGWDRAGGALNVVLASAVRLLQYALAALLSVMLAVAVIDDGPLLHIQVAGRHLLWYSLVFGGILTFIRSFDTAKANESPHPQLPVSPVGYSIGGEGDSMCRRLSFGAVRAFQQLHSVPFAWRQLAAPHPDDPSRPVSSVSPLFVGPRHQRLQNELCREFYSSRVVQFLEEMSGIILAPLVLGFYLPRASANICEFIHRHTKRTERIGDICVFGDLEHLSSETVADGKLEKSGISFIISCRCHPPFHSHGEDSEFWGVSMDTLQILRRVENFQAAALHKFPQLASQLPADVVLSLQKTQTTPVSDAVAASYIFWFDEMMGFSHLVSNIVCVFQSHNITSVFEK